MAQYSLETIDNYLETYDVSETEMFSKYINLLSEFTGQAQASISISNLDYYKYVIIKGIETITHVFRMLLLYTRNIELSYYNCKKALYYYIEFIGQIGEDNHEFLKLTSKDASLFVYKKTIFSLHNSFKKEYKENDDEKISCVNYPFEKYPNYRECDEDFMSNEMDHLYGIKPFWAAENMSEVTLRK